MSAHKSSGIPVASRKRVVTSCIACYSSKQKCDRRLPCENCKRRRRPERCVYQQPSASAHLTSRALAARGVYQGVAHDCAPRPSAGFNVAPIPGALDLDAFHNPNTSLTELFGYSEDNESNTAALLKRLNLDEDSQRIENDKEAPWAREIEEEIRLTIRRIPDRQVVDFLMQFFMNEINWMDQLVHPQAFLPRYEKWWATKSLKCVADLEFAVLFLRMSSYASQFLPSPVYTIERIRGVPLSEIRTTCNKVGDKLAAMCSALDSKGSLVRVQHLLFAGLRSRCEGRIDTFWDLLNSAIRVAQRLGMHRPCGLYTQDDMDELQCEIYNITEEQLPRMYLSPQLGSPAAPESFTERLLQVRLATFWRTSNPNGSTDYNAPVAEERYEKFCAEFLPTLHSAFALEPNTKWDTAIPALPLQRQRLRITILDSVCWNFRPVLRLRCSHVAGLSPYKRVLITSQRRALVAASLKIMEAVTTLHSLLGASHTRFVDVVFYTFEAAVLVLFLCTEPGYLEYHDPIATKSAHEDPMGLHIMDISKDRCLKAVRGALDRLLMLVEVSDMAAAGSRALSQLLDRWPEGLSMADFAADSRAYQDLPIFGMQMQEPNGESFADTAIWEFVPPVEAEDVISQWNHGAEEFDFSFADA